MRTSGTLKRNPEGFLVLWGSAKKQPRANKKGLILGSCGPEEVTIPLDMDIRYYLGFG